MMDRVKLEKRQTPKLSSWAVTQAEFVNKVKNQVRNRQKRMSNVAESGEEHSIRGRMFMAATMNAATFMGKNVSTIQNFIKNSEDLTLKQMVDVTAQLVNDQDDINGLDKILWWKDSWTRLSLIGDETVINLQRTKVHVSSDSALCLGKDSSTSGIQRSLEEKDWRDHNRHKLQGTLTVSMESRPNSSGTSSQDSQRCGSAVKSMIYSATWREAPETFTGRILFIVDVQRHFLWQERQWRRMFGKCRGRLYTCEEVWYRTMVIYWSRFREEVVFYGRE